MASEATNGQEAASLAGDWTVARAGELHGRARAWAAAGRDLELDCSGVGRVDLSALQVLLALSRSLAAKGVRLHLRAPSTTLTSAIALTGLDGELLG